MDPALRQRIDTSLADVRSELERAVTKHPPMTNAHEAYAVILEELDEFWEQVKARSERRSAMAMREELTQVAAMAVRAMVDLKL